MSTSCKPLYAIPSSDYEPRDPDIQMPNKLTNTLASETLHDFSALLRQFHEVLVVQYPLIRPLV